MFRLSLHGLGILNYENDAVSGEAAFVRKLAHWRGQERTVVFDVGANEGAYARAIRQHLENAELYAFEPHPKTYEALRRDAENHQYIALNLGLGDAPGEHVIYDYAHQDGSQHASLYRGVIEEIHKGESVSYRIALDTIDHVVEKHGVDRIHLLKIDTEGHELKVLQGAQRALERGMIELVHFEFNEMNVVSRVFFRDFVELLPDFRFYRMMPYGLMPLGEYSPVAHELFAYQNVLAVRKDSSFCRGV